MVKVIVVSNQKGGVAKTFTSCVLAYLLATDSHPRDTSKNKRKAERVLLVDTDFQADATAVITGSSRDHFVGKDLLAAVKEGDAKPYIVEVSDTLHILPSSANIAAFDVWFERQIPKLTNPFHLLNDLLEPLKADYDWIIIDTSPSLTRLKNLSFAVSNEAACNVIVPLKTDVFGFDSVLQFSDTLQLVKEQINPKLHLMGVLPVLVETRLNFDREILDDAKESFGDLLFKTVVKRKVALGAMVATGIREDYAHQRQALEDYYELLKEVREYAR